MQVKYDKIEFDGIYFLSLQSHCLLPDEATNSHFIHSDLEISYIKSGSGEYLVNGRKYKINEGDIFIFNNIEPHSICTIDPGKELVNTIIMFDPRLIWSIECNLFDHRYLKVFFNRIESFENKLDHSNIDTSEIRRLFLEIENEFDNKKPEYDLMVKVKLLNILVSLIRHYGTEKSENDNYLKRKHDVILINKVFDYVNHNYATDIKLNDLSAIAHMNSSYFSTFFKKYIGMSPWDYIAKIRINRAIEYLLNTDKTILEIAAACGFNNTSNFNKTFKRITGKVPSQLR